MGGRGPPIPTTCGTGGHDGRADARRVPCDLLHGHDIWPWDGEPPGRRGGRAAKGDTFGRIARGSVAHSALMYQATPRTGLSTLWAAPLPLLLVTMSPSPEST